MDYILVIWNPGQVQDGFLLISIYNWSQPGKEGGEGEGEHDGGDGVGEHEAEHQAGVRVLQDVSVLEQADYWIWKIYFTSTFKTDIQREDKYIGDHWNNVE